MKRRIFIGLLYNEIPYKIDFRVSEYPGKLYFEKRRQDGKEYGKKYG